MDIPFFQFFYKKSNSSPTYRKPTTSCYLFVKLAKLDVGFVITTGAGAGICFSAICFCNSSLVSLNSFSNLSTLSSSVSAFTNVQASKNAVNANI